MAEERRTGFLELLKASFRALMDILKKLIGEDPIERMLMLSALVALGGMVGALAVWLIADRPYNKYTPAIVIAFLLTAGGISLRYRLLEDIKEARELAKSTHSELGLSLEEAIQYYEAKAKLGAIKSWLGMIVSAILLGVLCLLWPV